MIVYYVLIFSLPYLRHPVWNAVLGGGITVTKVIGAINVLYAVIYLARRRGTPAFFAAPQSKWMLLLVTIAFYSFLTNERAELSLLNPIAMYTSALLLFFVTLSCDRFGATPVLEPDGSGGRRGFCFAISACASGGEEFEVYGGGFRPGWVLGDSNYFAVAALAVLPISFELFLHSRRKLGKTLLSGLHVAHIFGTYSRCLARRICWHLSPESFI